MPTAPSTIFCRAAMIALPAGAARHWQFEQGMSDPGFNHFHSCLRKPVLNLLPQLVRDISGRHAQGQLPFLMRIVGVRGRQVSYGRLALHVHKILVVIYMENGFGSFYNPPDHHRSNFYRIAVMVIDLSFPLKNCVSEVISGVGKS
jgi:hypothetical protein